MTYTADPAAVRLTDEQRALVVANRTFVPWYIGRRFPDLRGHPDLEDAVAAGMLGLLRAAQRYDPARGTFLNFAAWWVRQRVQAWKRDDRRKGFRGVGPDAPARVTSLDAARGDMTIGGALEAPDPDPADAAGTMLDAAELLAACAGLTPPQGRVLGLLYLDGLTRKQAAAELGITREAVREAEKRARRRLAEALPGLV